MLMPRRRHQHGLSRGPPFVGPPGYQKLPDEFGRVSATRLTGEQNVHIGIFTFNSICKALYLRRFTASLDAFKSNEKTTHHSMLLRLDGIGTSPENEEF